MAYKVDEKDKFVHGQLKVVQAGSRIDNQSQLSGQVRSSFSGLAQWLYDPNGDISHNNMCTQWDVWLENAFFDVVIYYPDNDNESVRRYEELRFESEAVFSAWLYGKINREEISPGEWHTSNTVVVTIYSVVDEDIPEVNHISGANSLLSGLRGGEHSDVGWSIYQAWEMSKSHPHKMAPLLTLIFQEVWKLGWGVDPLSWPTPATSEELERTMWLPNTMSRERQRKWGIGCMTTLADESGISRRYIKYFHGTTSWDTQVTIPNGGTDNPNDQYPLYRESSPAWFTGKDVYVIIRQDENFNPQPYQVLHPSPTETWIFSATQTPGIDAPLVVVKTGWFQIRRRELDYYRSAIVFHPIDAYNVDAGITDSKRAFMVKTLGLDTFWTNSFDETKYELEAVLTREDSDPVGKKIPLTEQYSYRSSKRFRKGALLGFRPGGGNRSAQLYLRRKGTPYISRISKQTIFPFYYPKGYVCEYHIK